MFVLMTFCNFSRCYPSI